MTKKYLRCNVKQKVTIFNFRQLFFHLFLRLSETIFKLIYLIHAIERHYALWDEKQQQQQYRE